MVIWECTPEDYEFIADLTLTFNARYYDVPVDKVRLEEWYDLLLDSDSGVVLRSEGGFIAGFMMSDPVRDWNTLIEQAWYATDRSGVSLLRAFIDHGFQLGADEVRMSTLHNSPEIASRILSKFGFTEIETSHRLIL